MNSREVSILVMLLIVIFLLAGFVNFSKKEVEQTDAKKFISEDLSNSYPGAGVEVLSMTERQNEKGEKYFGIKAKVTKNPESKCPERIHIYYNYPEQNFVPQAPEYITRNCEVCRDGKQCFIAFPEEAIIASYKLTGAEKAAEYISRYGDASAAYEKLPNSWNVIWNSNSADHYYRIEISTGGKVIAVSKISKAAASPDA